MSLQEIAALLRRHLAAVMVVFIAAAAVAVIFKRTPVMYQESGTVVFDPPLSAANPNPYTSFSESMVKTAGMVALIVMSPQDQQKIRAAGGSTYDAELFNDYNLEYPNYSDPYIALTATGTNPAQVHQTFNLVTRELTTALYTRQILAGASAHSRISAHVVGDSGPLAQPGSSKRVDAGLLALAIIAAFAVAVFLDRHPIRLRGRWGGYLRPRPTDDPRSSRFREQPAP